MADPRSHPGFPVRIADAMPADLALLVGHDADPALWSRQTDFAAAVAAGRVTGIRTPLTPGALAEAASRWAVDAIRGEQRHRNSSEEGLA